MRPPAPVAVAHKNLERLVAEGAVILALCAILRGLWPAKSVTIRTASHAGSLRGLLF